SNTTVSDSICHSISEGSSASQINEEGLIKIKRLSFDSVEGYMIIVWGVEVTFGNDIVYILSKFWDDYVINNIDQTPCSSASTNIFIRHPFISTSTSTNNLSVSNYTMKNVVDNFRLLVTSLEDYSSTLSKLFLDGCHLTTLAKHLNFKAVIVANKSKNYRRVWPNGTIIESLVEMVNHEVLYNANGRLLVDYSTKEYQIYSTSDQICAVVPKALKVPQWKSLHYCFDFSIWISIFLACISHFFGTGSYLREEPLSTYA
ncbi:hypothetical protein BDFB_004728, partial [Asbolus verrucosus]